MPGVLGAFLVRLMVSDQVRIGCLDPFPAGSLDKLHRISYSFPVQFCAGRLSW